MRALCFSVNRKHFENRAFREQWHNNHMISLPEFSSKWPVLVRFQISLAYCGETMFHYPEQKHHFEISLAYCEWKTFVGFSETKCHWMGGQSSDDPYLSTWVLLRHLAICVLFKVFSQWTRVCVPLGAPRDLTSIWFLQRKKMAVFHYM